MFERMSRGWALSMTAFGVIRKDKKLLIFPLMSGIALILVTLSFVLPMVLSPQLRSMVIQAEHQNVQNAREALKNVVAYVLLFAFYFVNYFVIVFFNSALISCAIVRFNGQEPTLSDGFGAAMSRLPQIFMWALVSATVGCILQIIENTSDKVGRFVSGLLGAAWGIVTYFVVPILVVEKAGPIDAVKRSVSIMTKVWGEGMVSNFSIGLIMLLLYLVAIVPAVAGMLVGGVAIGIGVAITVVLVLLLSLVSSAANTIVVAALYQYAAENRSPQQFDENTLQAAFVTK